MGLGFGLGPDVELRSASLLITESGGPEEELPCSTVALVPIEPLAKSSLDRVRCGAPLGLGEDQRRRPKKLCRQAGKSGFQASSSHLRAPERRISWWPGGYGAQKRRGLRSSQHPLRGGEGYELKSSRSSTSGWDTTMGWRVGRKSAGAGHRTYSVPWVQYRHRHMPCPPAIAVTGNCGWSGDIIGCMEG